LAILVQQIIHCFLIKEMNKSKYRCLFQIIISKKNIKNQEKESLFYYSELSKKENISITRIWKSIDSYTFKTKSIKFFQFE